MASVYTVSQVTAYLRESLEGDPILSDLFVVGEVSNLRVSAAGHSYFTLKDGQAVLNCVMFKGQPGSELLVNGAAVSTHGRISFYEPRGSTDYMVDLAMPEGVGELALELERLKVRLEAEGLFEESRKRPLPAFPQVIGVVTSPSGSVFHDIQNVIARRYPLVELLLSPSQVQGNSAAANLVSAIERLNQDGRADVIILARGGGSLEELWPFNEEAVARAIYASRTPVVSGVGHETDLTIADLVADLRAPTPSAAAELVVPDGGALRQELDELIKRSRRAFTHQQEILVRSVSDMARRLAAGLPDLATWRRRVDDLGRSMQQELAARLKLTQLQVASLEQRLQALEPAATLLRGYSVVQRADTGEVVRSTKQVDPGDGLNITVSDGQIPAVSGAGAGSSAKPRRRKERVGQAKPPNMERLL